MSESNRPFTDHVTRSQGGVNYSKIGWITAGVMAAAAVFFFCLWASLRANQPDIAALREKLQEANDRLANAQAQLQTNQDQIADLQSNVADLEQERDQAAQMSKGLENEMRSDLESRDVTISNLQGRLTVNILDRIMFDSGEAILKPDGQAVMNKIGAFLAQHPELNILVVGHTDNVPIRPWAHSRFASNWELSTARALAAVHFLTEQAGLDPRRVGAAGYGEYRPIADNSTPEGRARNRRIEITILPNELPLPSAVAPPVPVEPTNLPPVAPPPLMAPAMPPSSLPPLAPPPVTPEQ